MKTKSIFAIVSWFLLCFVFASSTSALPLSLNTSDFQHGTIVTDQLEPYVTISATNTGGGPNSAIIFDTGVLASSTTDDDLLGPPWNEGNVAAYGWQNLQLGNILIVAEDIDDSNSDGIVDDPDDEAGGGILHFSFTEDLTSFKFFLVDIEYNEVTSDAYFLTFFSDNTSETIYFADFAAGSGSQYEQGANFSGDNSLNYITLDFGPNNPFDKVDISLAGSGGVGFAPVPEPATILLIGTGLLGLAGIGRKKFLKK